MTTSVQNSVICSQPKPQGLHIGVLNPPEKFQKVVLYSDAEATQQFKQMNRDVCALRNKVSFEESKKTPKSVWAVIGTGILACSIFVIKKMLKK